MVMFEQLDLALPEVRALPILDMTVVGCIMALQMVSTS